MKLKASIALTKNLMIVRWCCTGGLRELEIGRRTTKKGRKTHRKRERGALMGGLLFALSLYGHCLFWQ